MHLIFRQENDADIKEIFAINSLAFGQENEAKLVDRLRQSNSFIPDLSLVATSGNIIVGHILFTKIKIIGDNKNEFESLALAPMTVKPKFQHQGIGGQLIIYGFDIAKNLGYTSIIVLGHKEFYRKFGFESASKWNIKSPFKLQDEENYMAIELIEGSLKNVSGLVKYANEFDAI
jgi:putative acetyltransferase